MRRVLFLLFCLTSILISAQELNCLVTVNADQISGSNRSVFKTLEKSISEFINQKKWTDRNVKPHERINCAFTIIVTKWENNRFEASLQVQATRPVYNTTYESPILNVRDNDFNFRYNEFDQLIYNPTRFDSNLVSTLAFYTYVILGIDADTFALNGGQKYFTEAQNTMLQAQQSGLAAWSNQVGKINRFLLIDNLLSSDLKDFRRILYSYHRNGLDVFHKSKSQGKIALQASILSMERLHNKTIENYLIRLFFDAKSDEIISTFSNGPSIGSPNKIQEVLKKISPNNANRWRKIE